LLFDDETQLTRVELRTLCLEIWVPRWAKFGTDDVRALGGLIEAAWNNRYWACRYVTFRNGANSSNARGGMVDVAFDQWSAALGIPGSEIAQVVRALIHLQFGNRSLKTRPGESWIFNT
jgi:hypothetical protein